MDDILLEACVNSVESAVEAATAAPAGWSSATTSTKAGTTPSLGAIRAARKHLDIGLNVMIRPRGGDFCYSSRNWRS